MIMITSMGFVAAVPTANRDVYNKHANTLKTRAKRSLVAHRPVCMTKDL